MSTDRPEQCEPCSDDGGCEPELIKHLKCKPAGIAAEAKSNADNQPAVLAAQEAYDKTRLDYRDARQLYSHDVHDLTSEIKSLVERIRCKFKQHHVAECLDEAHECIVERLEHCAGCEPPLNCEFDTETGDLGDVEFQHLKKRYEDDLARAKAHFEMLATEATDLQKRVTDAKAELAKVNAEYGGPDATTDPKEVYAHALVTKDLCAKLWNGFDSYTDYADTLCAALVCWTKAAEAVAIMARHDAVRSCHKDAEKKRCDDLATNTVKEILALYERICRQKECDDRNDDQREDDDEEKSYDERGGRGSRSQAS
jgi:hypothetical protein